MRNFIKDPDSDLDYGFDWANDPWLTAGETITTSTWTVPAGLTKGTESNTNGITSVFISGGTEGVSYTVTNRIVTDSTPPRTDERSFIIRVRQR